MTTFASFHANAAPLAETYGMPDIRTYFPARPGTTWIYEGIGNEFAGFTRTALYQEGERVQMVDKNAGSRIGKVFQVRADALILLFASEDLHTDKTLFDEKPNRRQVLLQSPLKPGMIWQDSLEKREIVSINEQVHTQAGAFQSVVKVKITPLLSPPINESFEYYAPGVGLIQHEFIAGKDNIVAKLKSFSPASSDDGAKKKIVRVLAESTPNTELEKIIIGSLRIPDEYLGQTRYYYNYVDLNMDGSDEIFVVVIGPYTSGTGGNTALHIIPTKQGMKVNQVFTLIHTPVIVSNQITNGVKELIVLYSGGGAAGKYVALTCSDGIFTPVTQGRVLEGLADISGQAIISNDLRQDLFENKALFLHKH